MNTLAKVTQGALVATLSCLPMSLYAGSVEVLHYWTSGGEARAVQVLKDQMEADGHNWVDFVVEGGGGGNAMASLQDRVLRGDPPTAAQIKGLDIQRWARLGFLRNIDGLAEEQGWDGRLPPVVAEAMQYNGNYVAVPVNVHRTNWLWANKQILDNVGVSVPRTWEEFEQTAEQIRQAGYQVIAQGNQDWQHATLFESVALSVGGPEFYQNAFVEHDFGAMKGDTMAAVFERYYRLVDDMNLNNGVSEWNQATARVINGEAAFQFMGDWAKGEFAAENKRPGQDYLCAPVPGTTNQFLFNIDSFAIFELREPSPADLEAQNDLVRNIMDDDFQKTFNQNKGSIPARTDMSMAGFDLCANISMSEFIASANNDALLPSIAHGMATTGTVQGYFYEKIGELTANPESPSDSARALAKAIRYGQYVIK
ncbi:ABC transporter substrate-binding protein [Saccharospirillum salsuginis]|uniref:Probable sugar-binding periplasmic protein n=1 Tax=Saccharospirillum salsuginis TaxID=418750 RepID=A0A918K411_9GAMM|nr:ABC transporter substrate-binding protein [Saccharospirillum salsuginis]GGX44606.1 sugar ABC transporter substrate-binding protein [Saccharospirillum salsuginis]